MGRGIALPFHDHSIRRGERSLSHPGRFLPPGKTRYPLYRRLGGPQGPYGQVRKISPPPGFDPQTVQPVASRYNDYATRPTSGSLVVPLLARHFQKLTELSFTSICILNMYVLNFYVFLTFVVQMTLLMKTDISCLDIGWKCNYTLEKYGTHT